MFILTSYKIYAETENVNLHIYYSGEIMTKILVTGAAGFIGFHLSKHLLERGDEVIGLDNLNDYYDVTLKKDRLKQLLEKPGFSFHLLDLADRESIPQIIH